MRTLLWACMVAGFVAMVWSAIQSDKVHADRRSAIAEDMNVSIETARTIDQWNDMMFFNDLSTGLCFAYLWKGAGNGGPMMAHVPCAGLSAVPFESGAGN